MSAHSAAASHVPLIKSVGRWDKRLGTQHGTEWDRRRIHADEPGPVVQVSKLLGDRAPSRILVRNTQEGTRPARAGRGTYRMGKDCARHVTTKRLPCK